MTDTKSKRGMGVKRRRRPPIRNEHIRYLVAIENWDWSYSFGINGRKDAPDPYMEFRHIQIVGKLIHPIIAKVDNVEINLLPNGFLDENQRKDDKPSAVGTLSTHKGRLTGLFSIPKDALTPILQMLVADRFRFVDMNGAPLKHRQALVTSLQLETHVDSDDMPEVNKAT